MNLHKIDSLEDLRRERARLQIEADVARVGIEKQMNFTSELAQNQFKHSARRVVGIGAIATAGIGLLSLFQRYNTNTKRATEEKYGASQPSIFQQLRDSYARFRSPNGKGWLEWLPFVTSLFDLVRHRRQVNHKVFEEEGENQINDTRTPVSNRPAEVPVPPATTRVKATQPII